MQTWKIKRGASNHSCLTFRLHSCLIFQEADRNFFISLNFEDVQPSVTKENVESRGAYFVVSVCISLYRYRYINLVNFFGLAFGNFHHQDLFSLNLDLVYGGMGRKSSADEGPVHSPIGGLHAGLIHLKIK